MDLSEVLRILIENGENNNRCKELITEKNMYRISYIHGENLMHWCAGYNNIEILNHLLSLGMTTILMNSKAASPIYYAAMHNNTDIIKLLIQYGTEPCCRSAFSGKLPKQVAKDEARDVLIEAEQIVPLDYTNNLSIKSGFNLQDVYEYRLVRYCDSILTNMFLLLNNRPIIDGIKVTNFKQGKTIFL